MEGRARAGESSADRILQAIRSEKAERGVRELLLSKFCSIFTPVMTLLAVLYAILLPMLTDTAFGIALHRALILLLIACSASFMRYLPTFYRAAFVSAAKRGIVFRNRSALDRAAGVDSVAFDQKGTLTHGRLRVSSVKAVKSDPEILLKVAAHACAYSEQTLAKAVVASFKGTIYIELIGAFEAIGEDGVVVTVDGVEIVVGSSQLLRSKEVFVPDFEVSNEIAWYLSIGGIYAGRIVFADDVKADAAKTIRELNEAHIAATLFTDIVGGENENNLRQLGIPEICHVSGTDDIISKLKIMGEQEPRGRSVLFVGNGKSEAAEIEKLCLRVDLNCLDQSESATGADIQILSEKTQKLVELIRYAKYANRIASENMTLILLMKAALLVLAILGKSYLWITVLVSMLVETAAILQTKRLGRFKPKSE